MSKVTLGLCNLFVLELQHCISLVLTPSHLLSLASTALYSKPLASSSLLLSALSVPVLAQVTETAIYHEGTAD